MNMCDISMVVFTMYLPHVYVESLVGSECARSSLCSFRVVLRFIVGYCCSKVCSGLFGEVLVLSSGWLNALLALSYGLCI